MATIALMIGGAILNVTAFIGGSYIAKSLSGKNIDAERKRHELALEKYKKDWAVYQNKKEQFEAWDYQQRQAKNQATENFKTMDGALKYYNETHQESTFSDDEPDFSYYYQPGDDKKTANYSMLVGGMLALGYLASKWLYFFKKHEKKALMILRELNEMKKKRDEGWQQVAKMINYLRLKLEKEKWQKKE